MVLTLPNDFRFGVGAGATFRGVRDILAKVWHARAQRNNDVLVGAKGLRRRQLRAILIED